MLELPFDIITFSWPHPVEQAGDQWISEPEWDAPLMHVLPEPRWADMNGDICWAIDWCRLFDGSLKHRDQFRTSGEMRGFHVVFQIRINGNSKLIFWDDDGCIIRRKGELIHSDRTTHSLRAMSPPFPECSTSKPCRN